MVDLSNEEYEISSSSYDVDGKNKIEIILVGNQIISLINLLIFFLDEKVNNKKKYDFTQSLKLNYEKLSDERLFTINDCNNLNNNNIILSQENMLENKKFEKNFNEEKNQNISNFNMSVNSYKNHNININTNEYISNLFYKKHRL